MSMMKTSCVTCAVPLRARMATRWSSVTSATSVCTRLAATQLALHRLHTHPRVQCLGLLILPLEEQGSRVEGYVSPWILDSVLPARVEQIYLFIVEGQW